MDVRAIFYLIYRISDLTVVQPNFVQGLHNLLIQSISNDTTQLKAVSCAMAIRFSFDILVLNMAYLGHRAAEPRVLQKSGMYLCSREHHRQLSRATCAWSTDCFYIETDHRTSSL